MRKIISWIEKLGKSKINWLLAIVLGAPTALIASFCLIAFWSGTIPVKILIVTFSSVVSVGCFRLLLSIISINESTIKVKLLNFALILIVIWAPALMIWENVSLERLILFPNQVRVQLSGRNGEPGTLKINSVSFEGSLRQFSPASLGDHCAKVDDVISSAPGEICDITYLITTHLEDRLNFEFDLNQASGDVQINTPIGNHFYEFDPVPGTGKFGLFPVNIESFAQKPINLINFITWFSIISFLAVIGLVIYSKLTKVSKLRNTSTTFPDIWVYIFFALISLVNANSSHGSALFKTIMLPSDAGNISSFVAAIEHPQNYVSDELLSNPDNFSEYYAFHLPLISGLSKVTGGYASAFMVLIAPVTFIQLCGYYLLGNRMLTNKFLALLFAIATAIPIGLPLFEYFGISSEILPRSLFQALLPFTLLLLLALRDHPKYYWIVSLSFTLLLYVHPVSGPAWVGVCLVTLMYFAIIKTGKRWWLYWLPAFLTFAFGVIPFLRAYLRPISGINIDPILFSKIQKARYASQLKPVAEFYKQDMVALLQSNWVLLTLLLVTLAFGTYGLVWVIKRGKLARLLKISQQSLLLSLWWGVLIVVAIVIPMLDELIADTLGTPLLLREIRRTMRYFVPMLWLTFFWVCQKVLLFFGKNKQPANHKSLVWVAIFSVLVCYGIEVQVWKNPILVKQWSCIQSGSLICKPDENTLAMYEFYSELPKYVLPEESVFPDPDPQYLADSLIPRYQSLRSVAYTYKDGGAVGDFLPEWWRITQDLKPYLPTNGSGLDPTVVEVARTTGADYFYFIHPDQRAKEYLEDQKVIFQNDYGTLISLK